MADDKEQKANPADAQLSVDDIVHGTFVKQGTMVAFPTCFPGASVPIRADESRITALSYSPNGMIYGGTSGRAAHLFVGMFHGVTGMILDRGVVEGADHCAAVCCVKDRFVACVNGPEGGRVVGAQYQDWPYDLIQEWGFWEKPIHELARLPQERILHAIASPDRTFIIGLTDRKLFTLNASSKELAVHGEVPGSGRIALGNKGGVFGLDGPGHLWRFDVAARKLERRAIALPAGEWADVPLTWARDEHTGLLYTADARGQLFSLDEDRGFSSPLGRTAISPVATMAVTHDGRLFGFCGNELANLFCYDPHTRSVADIGAAVSVLERRRYGYVFADAVTGRDGQIFFGENDDLGHLWIYFPSIAKRSA
ncbi:MAG TPA: hypothetical protein PL151_03235 [Phycisphaerae bacterium]|nr:hypothetical protein [Phycisphaerae bacterium]HOJ75416.1 hypothetical protein [Phycisphaerae bacterium]HOM49633.1 hypothetical protein [Phycisphaerae bacterium]HON68885.1 hypothetical protein [Phycisphaerae bacterium]HPP25000.1 hypothetical protein [Phycisphaerae bacterium]